MLIASGFALVYPGYTAKLIGFGLMIAALVIQYLRRDMQPA